MRGKDRVQTHTTDLLFTLGLFCVFAASAFILVMIGIRVYQATAGHMRDTYSTRTAISYVAEKLRRHDTAGGVTMGEVGGAPALVLRDELGGGEYLTYVYADGEALYEFTVREGVEIDASMGDKIIEVRDFAITDVGDGFFEFSVADSDGNTVRYLAHLRSDNRSTPSRRNETERDTEPVRVSS